MHSEIQVAFEIEKSGDYLSALNSYQRIDLNKLDKREKVFVLRSVSACLFYLKEYTKAEILFKKILKTVQLDPNEKSGTLDSLNICRLYGSNQKSSYYYFKNKTNNIIFKDTKSWDYWYIGQYYFSKKLYNKARLFYQKANCFAKNTSIKSTYFFLSHLLVSYIVTNRLHKITNHLNSDIDLKNLESKGLFKIMIGIYRKKIGSTDWKVHYMQGIRLATETKFKENIELGEFLLKEFG